MQSKLLRRTLAVSLSGAGFCALAYHHPYVHIKVQHFTYQHFFTTKPIANSVQWIWSLVYGDYYKFVDRSSRSVTYAKDSKSIPNNSNNNDSIRFVVISDTHETHENIKVPNGDILVHCGDILFSNSGPYAKNPGETIEKLKQFNEWLSKLPHRYKIVIAGNHDYCFMESILGKEKISQLLNNCDYLLNESFVIDVNEIKNNIDAENSDANYKYKNINVYASPYSISNSALSPNKAFQEYSREEIGVIWDQIPKETDVLITHMMPFGYCDLDWVSYKRYGCKKLREKIDNDLKKLKYHLFGHWHAAYGAQFDEVDKNRNTVFINASSVTSFFCQVQAPVVFDYKLDLC